MTTTLCVPHRTGNEIRETWQTGQRKASDCRELPRLPLDTEALLLAKLRAGDGDAWEDLVRQYGSRMYTVARRLLRTEDDSADAVQEAFLCLVRSLNSFEGYSRLWTWLYRILANICLGKLRARSRRHTVSIHALLPAFDETGAFAGADGRPGRLDCWCKADRPEAELSRNEIQAQVRACVDQLPEPYRTVLILRDMEELNTQETCRLLGLSLAAVKTRLHRARQALRTLLESRFLLGQEDVCEFQTWQVR